VIDPFAEGEREPPAHGFKTSARADPEPPLHYTDAVAHSAALKSAPRGVPLHAATRLSADPEVAHLPEEPSICDRCDRFRRSRLAIRRRPWMDHASWPARHQGAGWHPLQAYRAIVEFAPVVAISLFQSCRSALRPKALRARLLRGPHLKAASVGLGQSTTFTVSLKGITETQAVRHSRIAHDYPRSRAEPSGPQFFYGDCTGRLPRTIRNTAKACSKK